MSSERRARVLGPTAILLAFGGLWLSHTLEYLRSGEITSALLGSVHLYMLPLGFVLAASAAVLGVRGWGAWTALGRRLARAQASITGAWRGPVPVVIPDAEIVAKTWQPRLFASWLVLSVTQLALYLVQENAEAHIDGVPLPGLGVLTGEHRPALVIHLIVAAAFALLLIRLARLMERRTTAIEACERLVREILRRRISAPSARAIPSVRASNPLAVFGRQLWRRPPPNHLSTTTA